MTDRRQHAAHLTVLTLMDRQFHLRPADTPHPFRKPLANAHVLGGLGHAVFQPHTGGELLECLGARHAAHGRPVGLRNVVLGMGQRVKEIAVVGEED